jgi:hypothetical protein
MTTVVLSQPMFFPWVGMFEQMWLADVYVHYDDAQFSKGSFTNRVQIKTAQGSKWLSVPLRDLKLGQRIAEVAVDDRQPWRERHLAILQQNYDRAPFRDEMLALVREVYAGHGQGICALAVASMEKICRYFESKMPRKILYASQLGVAGRSSQRVLDIVKRVGGSVYVTGHGARNYLDHQLFEDQGVRVEYMDYQRRPYPQLFGEFTPFVSTLDLIANLGRAGRGLIEPKTVYWRDFAG